ncbi:hypothetical protein [Paracraurococcus ruber]|uniref:Uncharacterized protein n=1 Tax=Paracraurococcus ruber TaxID=77675 RepID=A0ABS1D6Q5_9PROT|nr:hypothetical protein [Paracraurococcus ruber]MBK1662155.1 hypothetical protein [Paracraurococcus ruber]TDG16185.1 hypothetical protein E2C05_29595 [Paracraurococcus ruber]
MSADDDEDPAGLKPLRIECTDDGGHPMTFEVPWRTEAHLLAQLLRRQRARDEATGGNVVRPTFGVVGQGREA